MNSAMAVAAGAIKVAKVIFFAGFIGGAACGCVIGWSLSGHKDVEFKIVSNDRKSVKE